MSRKSKLRRKREREARFKRSSVEILKSASQIQENKTEPKKESTVTKFKPKICHEFKEIYPNFWLSSIRQAFELATFVDVLVPLDSLDGDVWKYFDGEIHYWPICDMSVLPTKILDRAVNDIISCLKQGKKVGMFCLGGHGRTGYLAACVLGKLGIEDPIQRIHDNYCTHAIETLNQYKSIANYLNKPELVDHQDDECDWYNGFGGYYGAYSGFTKTQPPLWTQATHRPYGLDFFDNKKDEEDEESIDINAYILNELKEAGL